MTRNQPKPPETTPNQPKPALPIRNRQKRDLPSLEQTETNHCGPKQVHPIIDHNDHPYYFLILTSNGCRGDSTPDVKGRWYYQKYYQDEGTTI